MPAYCLPKIWNDLPLTSQRIVNLLAYLKIILKNTTFQTASLKNVISNYLSIYLSIYLRNRKGFHFLDRSWYSCEVLPGTLQLTLENYYWYLTRSLRTMLFTSWLAIEFSALYAYAQFAVFLAHICGCMWTMCIFLFILK